MQKSPRYTDVVAEVRAFLEKQAHLAEAAGVRRSRIIIDPGLGFAKNARHNLELMGGLPELCALGYPVLVGASRKRFVRATAGGDESDLQFGSAAVNALAITAGASIITPATITPENTSSAPWTIEPISGICSSGTAS